MSQAVVLLSALASVGCRGAQSALDPAGPAAARIAALFCWMTLGATIVWLAVVGLGAYYLQARHGTQSRRRTTWLIIGGGALVPTVVLAVLLAYGLALLPDLVALAPAGSLRISVSGEQWWWRVRYRAPDGGAIELANEIHIPVGETVDFHLESVDVIHSFWVPALGGKLDMFPGRTGRLALKATRTGVFRGVCAEYCGTSHALMSFYVVAQERGAFDQWLAQEARPAQAPATPRAVAGQALFLASGCGACHAVRGTAAEGVLGPDLTHVGGRLSLGAGTLPNQPEALRRWLAHTEATKPGVLMPTFGMLSQDDLHALGAYLGELK